MSESGSIVCPTCSRRYAFKTESAGKRGKCKCGAVLVFPAGPVASSPPPPPRRPAPPADPIDMPLDLRPTEYEMPQHYAPPAANACRQCRAPLQPGAVLCVQCGCNQRTGERVGTQILRDRIVPVSRSQPQTPYANEDSSLSATEWVVVFLCPGIGFIAGLIYTIQGKPSGSRLLICSIVSNIIHGAIGFGIGLMAGPK